MMENIQSFGLGIAYVILGMVLLLIAKIIKDLLTPYKLDQELSQKDNPAPGVALAGYYAGVIIIFLGAVIGSEAEQIDTFGLMAAEAGIDLAYALVGILALNLGSWIVDKLVLRKFSTRKEIIEDRNVGTGAVEAGCMIATALVIAGAVSGEGGGPLTALAFYAAGQIVLVLFALFYQWITRYDIHEEIEKDNVAAGLALGLSTIAIGLIICKAAAGDFEGWGVNFSEFGLYAVLGFAVLMILRKVTDVTLLPGTTIGVEIARDRNVNAGWIEGVVAVGIAAMIFFLL